MKKAIYSFLFVSLISVFVIGCSDKSEKVLTGTGKGLDGDISVEVTLAGDKITAIKLTEFNDTEGLGDSAANKIFDQVVSKNTIDGIDTVAGATYSSNGTIDAIKDALSKK